MKRKDKDGDEEMESEREREMDSIRSRYTKYELCLTLIWNTLLTNTLLCSLPLSLHEP